MLRSVPAAPAAMLGLLASSLTAQFTWVVDGLRRPGSHYADLPPCVAVAAPGDMVVVRGDAPAYTGFATNKGLTLIATPQQAVVATTITGPVTVANLPSDAAFTMSNFRITGPEGGTCILVNGCSGRVVFDRCSAGVGAPIIDLVGAGAVILQDCSVLFGFPCVRANGSFVELVHCYLQGGQAEVGRTSGTALQCLLSSVVVERSTLVGGHGVPSIPSGPAVQLDFSILAAGSIAGTGILSAGRVGSSPAVTGTAGTLLFDPALTMFGVGGAPPTSGIVATPTQRPGLALDLGTIGQVGIATRVPAGTIPALIIGLPAAPSVPAGVQGTLWLDPNSLLVAFGVGPSVATPTLPRGLTLMAQLAALGPAGADLSNPAVWVAN